MTKAFDPADTYKVVEDMVTKGQTAFQSAFSNGTENAQKGFEQMASAFQEQAGKTQAVFAKGYEDMTAMNQSNIDAAVKCGTTLAKGAETFGQAAMAVTQKNLEAGVAHAQALAGVKNINDLINLNTTFARSTMDVLVAESTKLSDMGVKMAQEAFEPIQAQFNATVAKASETVQKATKNGKAAS